MGRVVPDFMNRRTGLVQCSTKYIRIVGQEERYQGCWYVERWSKDDADVPDSHLVKSSVVHDLDQKG
jgi:hypothetical protein